MTHPDRRRYGGLAMAGPDPDRLRPARFDTGLTADFTADTALDLSADASADYSADTSADFPAEPTGPAARGFRRNRG